MATFRTGADGRTVISDDNRVTVQAGDIDRGGFTARERAAGLNRVGADPGTARTVNRFDGDPRSGGFGPPVLQDPGTGYMTRQEFENVAGMTDTNPYGRDGFFSRVFGIDPNKIDYTNNLGPRGIENVKRQAYDRFLNPFAKVDAFGRPTMGADASLGLTRSGVQPGDLTVFGPAVQSQREGIAGLFENTMLGSLMPKQARIPGYDTNVLVPELGLGGPQPGEGVDPAQRFGAQSEVDYSGMGNELLGINPPRVDERLTPMSLPGNVDDLGNELGAFPEPEDRFAFEDRKGQSTALPTVADIIAAEPMVTEQSNAAQPRLPTGPKVIQGIPGGDPGSASITVNPQSQSPEYVAPDQPVDLLSDILAPDGNILPGVMEGISSGQPRREVDPRTGRIPGTSGTFDFPSGGFPDPRVSPPQLTPEQVQRANENNVAMQRRAQLMAQGMSVDAARMQAEREKIRARAARLGLVQ